jgi:hypothetical protein
MSNLKEIRDEASETGVKVSILLKKTKILASELEQEGFVKWIDKELNGYSKDDKVPEYRIVKGTPQGFNPYRGWIPYIHTDPKSQEIISERGIGQPVAELESLLDSRGSSFEVKFPANIEKTLRKGVQMDVDLRLFIDKSEVVGILEHLRNAVLDWSIKLKKEGVSDGASEFTKKEIHEAERVEPQYQIQHIENFQGNLGGSNNRASGAGVLIPRETFWTKFIWYGVVALGVLILGNILSALLLKHFFSVG